MKWIEDKTGNLISTGFGRDVYLQGELAVRKEGKMLGVRMHTISDHGAFFADAQPSKFKIGLMHSAFACYDIPVAHLTATGTYTNQTLILKSPVGNGTVTIRGATDNTNQANFVIAAKAAAVFRSSSKASITLACGVGLAEAIL